MQILSNLFFTVVALFTMLNGLAQITPAVDSIPMRDGKKLAADIYIPAGCTQCPAILIQTPYNRQLFRFLGLPLGIGNDVDSSKYVFVISDWRGFYGSASATTALPNRGEDGYDAIDWITQQSWSNDTIGTWGPSALGKVQFQTAREQHPAHICGVPLVAGSQFDYDEYFPGGAARTEFIEQLDALGYGLSPFLYANPVHNLTWQFAETSNMYPQDINTPMLMIGGWYDHNADIMISLFDALKNFSGAAVKDEHRLLMGPWVHGGSGTAYVGSANQGELTYNEVAGWSDSLAMAFFDHYLMNENNGWNTVSPVTYFQLGENRWETDSMWPPAGIQNWPFYLVFGLIDPYVGIFPDDTSTIIYDPADPSPTRGGPTLRADQVQGPYDQKDSVESRNDVLVFTSLPFSTDIVIKGKPKVHLFVSSDRADTDFAVRLTDVYPDSTSMLLSDGIQRMRFRNGNTAGDTSAITPGQVYEIIIDLPQIAHTILQDHQIRLDITSSNYPRFNRNMNTGGEMYPNGNGDTLVNPLVATNKVYQSAIYPSRIEFPLEGFSMSIAEKPDKITLFKLYPNPAGESVLLRIENREFTGNLEISLLDIGGKMVNSWSETMINKSGKTIRLDTHELQNGIYFVHVSAGLFSETQKLVIIR